ncbi:dihydroorotase [Halorarius litoreus]|uniref:dihydroorotase n=1 Tax=Halorarius litoreus TaxID=2962676 RepID=UPI0020CF0B05|nr:amidohydrolase family protein [Halorarius litoreus]
MSHDLVVQNGTVVSVEHGTFRADVAADDGVISAIARPNSLDGDEVVDAAGKYVLPGAIDPHVHYGLFRDYELDHETETHGDLVGGVTTVGNIFRRPGKYTDIMAGYFEQSEANSYHDYFYTLGILSPDHVAEIPDIVDQLGITTFKWYALYKFLTRSKFGLDNDLDDAVGDGMIQALAGVDAPTTLGYHAENTEITQSILEPGDPDADYHAFRERYPGYAETQSMVSAAALAKLHDYDQHFYTVHISSGGTADEIAALRHAGYDITGETCPQYLVYTADECDARMKVTPPMRDASDRETLWKRLADGTLSCIGTDHVPNTLDEKLGDDLWETGLAFSGTQTMLPLILSEGVNEGRISLERAVAVTSTNTAKAWKLYPKKGTIRMGSDADLAVVDLDETKTVTADLLQAGSDYSIYEGMEVTGWPTHTIVRGRVVFEEGEVTGEKGYGTHVDRPV